MLRPGARKPTLDVDGQVHWPLMFVYPETMQVRRRPCSVMQTRPDACCPHTAAVFDSL